MKLLADFQSLVFSKRKMFGELTRTTPCAFNPLSPWIHRVPPGKAAAPTPRSVPSTSKTQYTCCVKGTDQVE